MLDLLIPTPRLVEIDRVELAAPVERVWQALRHGDLGRSALTRALFALRTVPDRLLRRRAELELRIDDLRSSPEHPGFQLLAEDPAREFVVGAIGKVWHAEIPFVHVADAPEFAAFSRPGFVKVAWSIRVEGRGAQNSEIEFELRVDATDERAWNLFKRYFRVIGPASHFIRRSLLASLAREFGTPESEENIRALPGDELIADAAAQMTHSITIHAAPERIWPWLLQMGCRRGGFYAIDLLDNGGTPSARELHPDLLGLAVGDVIPATPDGDDGFEVLRVDGPRTLALGGLYDGNAERQLPFSSPRPARYSQMTWVFALEPLTSNSTRLHVRVRVAFSRDKKLYVAMIRPVHHLMQTAMLRNLAARAEGLLDGPSLTDVASGVGGVLVMLGAFLSPFARGARCHWGLDRELAARRYPGDELVPRPRWGWTHGVEIQASPLEVWPWVAQIGADRAGFYSYEWLENLIGCDVFNAETVHPEWEAKVGQELVLHPEPGAPRMKIVALETGKWLIASAVSDAEAQRATEPWIAVSWLFWIEPLDGGRSRLISRYRVACSDDLASRLSYGPTLMEPVGFAMDRRMLLGIKERVERAGSRPARSFDTSESSPPLSQELD